MSFDRRRGPALRLTARVVAESALASTVLIFCGTWCVVFHDDAGLLPVESGRPLGEGIRLGAAEADVGEVVFFQEGGAEVCLLQVGMHEYTLSGRVEVIAGPPGGEVGDRVAERGVA